MGVHYSDGIRDPCSGDSGGPLLVKKRGEMMLVATVFGDGFDCVTGTFQGDGKWNTVRPYIGWIMENGFTTNHGGEIGKVRKHSITKRIGEKTANKFEDKRENVNMNMINMKMNMKNMKMNK